MTSGVNEILWHFVGYLHLTDELARARQLYDESASRTGTAVFHDVQHHEVALPPVELGDLAGNGLPVPYRPDLGGSHSPVVAHGHLAPFQEIDSHGIAFSLPPQPSSHALLPAQGPVSGSLVIEHRIVTGPEQLHPVSRDVVHDHGKAPSLPTYTYSEGGHDKFIRIEQSNTLDDNDHVLAGANDGVSALHAIDVADTLQGMVEATRDLVSEDFRIADHNPVEIAQFVEARDTLRASGSSETSHEAVAPGRYVNGVATPDPGTAPDKAEAPAAQEHPHDTAGHDQVADLGSNNATNAALIVDVNEATSSMIVVGDYFRTNAVVQTNMVMDNDTISTLGANSDPDVASGGNQTDNIASFVEKSFAGDPHGTWHNLKVNVDVVNGDFFDVKSLVQKNWLFDNDTVVQSEYSAYAQVRAGGNTQVDAAKILDWAQHYDLIIVCGDYHQANLIFQTNILLDNDVLRATSSLSDADGVTQSAHTGENSLTNEAKITNHGLHDFQALSGDLSNAVTALGQGGDVDPLIWNQISASASGTMNVLYITGDYYDLNVISQINVVADVDTVTQVFGALPDASGGATQHAATGGNVLVNSAEIYDFGTAYDQFLGGEYYEDSLLVQANLVEDVDDVQHGDTETLVSEVIAFTGWDETDDQPSDGTHPTVVPGTHGDVMGGVLT